MNFKLLFIYLFSFFLLTQVKMGQFHSLTRPKLMGRHPLTQAVLVGNKQALQKKVRKQYKILHLQHLFTPSGLHLSIFLFLLSPLFSLLRRIHIFLPMTIKGLLLVATLLLDSFWSLKRMAIYYLLGHRLNTFARFILTFCFSWIFGHFRLNPLSFIFSFLFFGIIICSKPRSKLNLLLNLYTGQLMAGYFFNSPIFFLGPILGFLWTGFFSLISPLILINAAFPSWKIIEGGFIWWENGIKYSASLTKYFGSFSPNIYLLVLMITLAVIKRPSKEGLNFSKKVTSLTSL